MYAAPTFVAEVHNFFGPGKLPAAGDGRFPFKVGYGIIQTGGGKKCRAGKEVYAQLKEPNNSFWEALYQSTYQKLYRLAYRLVKSPEAADDLVHDTFCLAVFHQAKLRQHPNPEGWLVLVLKNLASNEIRRAENRLTVPLQEALSSAAAAQHTSVAELFPRDLPIQDRQILLWRFESQLPYAEIALRLHISESGVRSRVARAVARCRLLMKETNFSD